MDKSDQVLGVDFGTSNSHFCKYRVANVDNLRIRDFDFGNNQKGSVSSTVLYRSISKNNILIGAEAEQEWGDSTAKEKKEYILRTHFKPDIATNEEAKKNAIDFLGTIKDNLQNRRMDFFPDKQRVIMGIPALADEKFQNSLKDVAQKAGYGEVKFLSEPVGALLYHLWNRDLSARQINSGILVIDFGGGTCDFSYVQHLKVRHNWGDMSLGGRLFDDLFYQWFLDQNPDILNIINENDEYFIHWFICRNIKEDFSNKMRADKKQTINKRNVWNNYSLKNMTWEEFKSRAKKHKPHKTFIKYLEETNQNLSIITDNSNIDLLEWFKMSLIGGLDKYKIRPSDINNVILAGGSSQWLFVEELLCEILHFEECMMLSSDNPKAAISEGLVLYPHLKHKLSISRKNLSEGLDIFIKTQITPEIELEVENIVDYLSKNISSIICGDKFKSRLIDFRENGGAIKSLNANVHSDILMLEPQIIELIDKNMEYWKIALQESILNKTKHWFDENGIKFIGSNSEFNLDRQNISTIDNLLDLESSIVKIINAFISSIAGLIIAPLAGGSGIALIANGPIGLIIGFVIGSVIAFWLLKFGKDVAKQRVESIYISNRISKMIISKKRINKLLIEGKNKAEKNIKEILQKNLKEPLASLLETIKFNIKEEIDSLDVINQL